MTDFPAALQPMFDVLKMTLPELPEEVIEQFKAIFDEELMRRKIEA